MTDCTLNWGQIFFINLSFWPTAIFLSTWAVAYFVWCPMKKRYENMRLPPPPYEDLYIIEEEDKLLLNENIDKTERENNFIIEKTPSGNVIMKYSIKYEGFEYWTDQTIPYKHLETVARKYVKTFHCVDLYIDRQEMVRQKKDKLLENKKIEEERKKEKKEDKDSVFASFKSYNKGGSQPVPDNSLHNPAAETANKYIRRGKFKEAFVSKEFNNHIKAEQKTNVKNLDFSAFKKLFSSS